MAKGSPQPHACGHDHAEAHLRAPQPGAGHHHAPSMPHPAQATPWSLLRMGLAARLGGSLLIAAALWIFTLATLRPL
ncbi:hypothetical protein [Afipia felis]|uniref:Uncharacterized protein n=2 Tax=Afipia felis TaxID=1035 RepID=A0A380W410_AFIFE|nr:hypothetical protein [Afipia felis]EKS30879.1 hypothetical protein HMPREF9697_03407 [Afipia felis ATCC 53690]SUU75624.1 Uncharacterised protein [Afipia felis]SUU83691.1 Uncharacterised protein [Afipia felis]